MYSPMLRHVAARNSFGESLPFPPDRYVKFPAFASRFPHSFSHFIHSIPSWPAGSNLGSLARSGRSLQLVGPSDVLSRCSVLMCWPCDDRRGAVCCRRWCAVHCALCSDRLVAVPCCLVDSCVQVRDGATDAENCDSQIPYVNRQLDYIFYLLQ